MTLSDLQDHSPVAVFFKFDFSHSYGAIANILICMTRRAVSPRQSMRFWI